MISVLMLLAETAALVTVVGLIQLVLLIFRNPHRPQWLHTDTAYSLTTIGLVAAFAFTVAFEIAGFVAVGINGFVATALSAVVVALSSYACWRCFDGGERLRRADAGESPFLSHAWLDICNSGSPRSGT